MFSFRYVIKNTAVSLKQTPLICALYIICSLVSTLAVLFSHGVYQNYASEVTFENYAAIGEDSFISLSFGEVTDAVTYENEVTDYYGSGSSSLGELRMALSLLDDDTKASFTGFSILYDFEDTYKYGGEEADLASRIEYDEDAHAYGLYQTFADNISVSAGRYLTQEEELNGEYVIVLPCGVSSDMIGSTVELLGNEYEIIGIEGETTYPQYLVPFNTLPDELTFSEVSFLTDKPITTSAYRKIVSAFNEVYGDEVNFPDFKTVDETEQTFYASIIMISVVLSALSAVTLAILFRYIIFSRRKTIAVFRLSGCTRLSAGIMYNLEAVGSSAVIFALSTVLYHTLILPKLTLVISKITQVYTLTTYVCVFAVFIAVLTIMINIMILFQVDKRPIDMLKKAGGR